MDIDELRESLAGSAVQAVDLARRLGADQAEAASSFEKGLSVTVRMGELESLEHQQDRGLAITVYRNNHKGSASTNDFSARSLAETVEKALSIASFTTADPKSGLADEELMAVDPPDLDLYHPWKLSVDEATQIALNTEGAARGADRRIQNSEGATVSSSAGLRAYANSHGFCGAYPTSSHSNSCSVVAKAENGTLERDYWYTVARCADDLEGAQAVGIKAAERAVRRLGARQISTRRLPVLFPAELARGLFGHFIAGIRGTSQYRKASFLLDACGKRVFPEWLNINEDPLIPRGMASAAFDLEGVATARRQLVEDGVLTGYVLSSYSARRLGLKTTGNAGGVHNLLVRPNAGSLGEIIADCDEAFVVGELLGQGVNTVTGDYSRGAAGFLVERGEIKYPVNEVTIAGSLTDMFAAIEAVGNDIDLRGAVRCGAVLIGTMTVAGQ